ncbi:MAG: hypothetical protein WBE26_03580 [Phycisphaerae bacterium]
MSIEKALLGKARPYSLPVKAQNIQQNCGTEDHRWSMLRAVGWRVRAKRGHAQREIMLACATQPSGS